MKKATLLKNFLWTAFILVTMMVFVVPIKSNAATVSGTYPTRKGVILVTADAYKNLIPTGHAAIIYNKNTVVESLSGGVTTGKNNWNTRKKTVWGVSLKNTTARQDATAADWCYNQIGKKYNHNYVNVTTRKKFYCSHLVYAAFLDNFNINLNTNVFGNAVHPMELVSASKTYTIYYYKR